MPSCADTAGLAASLLTYGVATLHEALGRRGLASGLALLVGPAFAGPAVTVALPAGDNLGIHALLGEAAPGSVACIASEGRGTYGVYGDILALAAKERSLAALVIDDGIRDIASLVAPPSVAACGISAVGTQKRRFHSMHEPVALGGVLVRPGDWVIGDGDGVCVVPAVRLDALLGDAAARIAKEDSMRLALQDGRTTVEVLGLTGLLERGDARS